MVRKAATVALVTSSPVKRVDAARDQDVVEERDEDRHGVFRLEPDRHVDRDHEQGQDQRLDGVLGDLLAERGPDRFVLEPLIIAFEPEGVGQRPLHGGRLIRRDLRLHLDHVRAEVLVLHRLDLGRVDAVDARVVERRSDLLRAGVLCRARP